MDYSPTAGAPVGLEDCSKYEAITYELLKRGYGEADVRKVLGENTLRVMEEAERLAERLSRN
jgi:membrane dipeptidase